MPTQIEDNEFLMRCSCGERMEHVAWLIHEQYDSHGNNLKGVEDDWYLMPGLDPRFGFWRRLWTGLRYAINPRLLRYSGYCDLILTNEDVDRLAEFIQRRRANT